MKYLLAILLFVSACDAQYRGFMTGTFDTHENLVNNLHDIRATGANLIRWQLVGNIFQISEWNVETYNQWLETELQKLDRLLPTAEALGLKIIVDMHHPIGGVEWRNERLYTSLFFNRELRSEFVEQWKRIANRYKNQKAILGWDILNEPSSRSSRQWNKLVVKTVKALRRISKKKKIIISTRLGDPRQINSLPVYKYKNVWYTAHVYYPKKVTDQGLPEWDCSIKYPIRNVSYKVEKLKNYVQPLRDFQKEHGVKIYIGEFSATRWSINGNDLMRKYIRIFNKYKWHWSYHAFREAGVWNPEYSNQPCPNPCDMECVDYDPNSERLDILIEGLNR